jgi:hypothetical protein
MKTKKVLDFSQEDYNSLRGLMTYTCAIIVKKAEGTGQ